MEDKYDLTFEEEEDLQKQIITLLLSGADRPIKQRINFQKELFLLTRAFPKFQYIFNFQPHKFGPYSDSAEYVVDNNVDIFAADSKGIYLTDDGLSYSSDILEILDPVKKEELTRSISIIRDIYDGLTTDEFMFLIYNTYGFTEKSERFDNLLKRKKQISKKLYDKKVITYQRYMELIGE